MREHLNNIRAARKAAGLTMKELGARVGVKESTISQYETGKRQPDNTMLLMLAEELNTTVSYLLAEDIRKERVPILTDDVITLPILGDVAAGFDRVAIEDWEGDSIDIPRSYLKGRPLNDFFVLRVTGNSMYPMFMEGDIVLVLRQPTLNHSGDIGVILYDQEEASLKKVEFAPGEDWMRLVPINPNIPPQMIEKQELEKCRVLGVPKMVIREI